MALKRGRMNGRALQDQHYEHGHKAIEYWSVGGNDTLEQIFIGREMV